MIEGGEYTELRDMMSTGTSHGRAHARSILRKRSSSCSGTLTAPMSVQPSCRSDADESTGTPVVREYLGKQVTHKCKEHIKQLNSTVSDLTICLWLGPPWINYWFSFTLAYSRISHEYSSLFIIAINLIFVLSL